MKVYIITKDGELTNHQTTSALSLMIGLEFLEETHPEFCWDFVVKEVI